MSALRDHGNALTVLRWDGPRTLAGCEIGPRPLVLSIATPDSSLRITARSLARQALQEALGVLLARSPHEVPLISEPGSPIRFGAAEPQVSLSLSHEPGLTLAAIHMGGGAVGIDLMRVAPDFDWIKDWELVAGDYLGSRIADRLGQLPPAEQAHAFAREWTRFEASLKCHGLQLQEWNAMLGHKLARCRLTDLDLPGGFIGTLAVLSETQPH